MKHTSKFRSLAATLFTIGSLAGGANGAIQITVTESGGDLLFTTTGSLNTDGLTIAVLSTNASVLKMVSTAEQLAFSGGPHDFYGITSGFVGEMKTNTFSGGGFTVSPTVVHLDSGGGDFGFRTSFLTSLWTPRNYVSGTPVFQVMRWDGASFASLGINEGEFAEFSWTSGAGGVGGDSIRMQAGAIPEPSSALLLGLAALGFSARRRR